MFYFLNDPKMYDRDCLKKCFFIAYSEQPLRRGQPSCPRENT